MCGALGRDAGERSAELRMCLTPASVAQICNLRYKLASALRRAAPPPISFQQRFGMSARRFGLAS